MIEALYAAYSRCSLTLDPRAPSTDVVKIMALAVLSATHMSQSASSDFGC